MRLWRAEPFAGLESPWLAVVRASLDAERLAATLDRNDIALRVGRHADLLGGLSELAVSVPRQLPAPPVSFVGRSREVVELGAAVVGDDVAMVFRAISGAPGVGKTTLALHWAHQVAAAARHVAADLAFLDDAEATPLDTPLPETVIPDAPANQPERGAG